MTHDPYTAQVATWLSSRQYQTAPTAEWMNIIPVSDCPLDYKLCPITYMAWLENPRMAKIFAVRFSRCALHRPIKKADNFGEELVITRNLALIRTIIYDNDQNSLVDTSCIGLILLINQVYKKFAHLWFDSSQKWPVVSDKVNPSYSVGKWTSVSVGKALKKISKVGMIPNLTDLSCFLCHKIIFKYLFSHGKSRISGTRLYERILHFNTEEVKYYKTLICNHPFSNRKSNTEKVLIFKSG